MRCERAAHTALRQVYSDGSNAQAVRASDAGTIMLQHDHTSHVTILQLYGQVISVQYLRTSWTANGPLVGLRGAGGVGRVQ